VQIAFWASGTDGSSWYRCEQPAMALGWAGHRVWSSQILPATVQARTEVVVGSRIALPGSLVTWYRLKEAGKRLIFDIDDNYFQIDPAMHREHAFWSDPVMQDGLREAIQLSDRCTCVSEAQAEILRGWHSDVRVVPNGLHAWMLSGPRDYRPPQLNIGWSGTGSTVISLTPPVVRALNRIARYDPPASSGLVTPSRVFTVGVSRETVRGVGLDTDVVGAEGWQPPGNKYLGYTALFDIQVAPYLDTPFNQAKFPTKALEASFAGIPLIASDIRPYREWIDHGVDGFLVRDDHEWGMYLKMLVDDPDLRERIGLAARAKASSHTLQTVGRKWEEAIS
jgi:glycosyltransferase involved in cell wall biosynthesis